MDPFLPEELCRARARGEVLRNKSPEYLDDDDFEEAKKLCRIFASFGEVSGLTRALADLCKRSQ